jgi:hypothetical protein
MIPGMLFSQMQPPPREHGLFSQWYETDHIPARMRLPGFRAARRFEEVSGRPSHLATYDLTSLDALSKPGYLSLKDHPSALTRHMLDAVTGFTRFTCELITDDGSAVFGAYLSVVAFAVPPAAVRAFDRWYDEEHIPLLLQGAGWLRVRRFRVVDAVGAPWTHLALHELASAEAMDSPERSAARAGPLRDALASAEWFTRSGRWLYKEISRLEAAATSPVPPSGRAERPR